MITTTHVEVNVPRFVRIYGYAEIGVLAVGGYLRSAEYETDPEDSILVLDLRNSWIHDQDRERMLTWIVKRALDRPSSYSLHESMYDAWH